jgi:hypothetical protein
MLGKSRNWQDKVIDDPQPTYYEALHNGTAAAGLLGSIRVFPLVNLESLSTLSIALGWYILAQGPRKWLTYLTPYRRHHEVAGAIAVGDQPNPISRDLSVKCILRQLATVEGDKRRQRRQWKAREWHDGGLTRSTPQIS